MTRAESTTGASAPVEVRLGATTFVLTPAGRLELAQDGFVSAVFERAGLTDPALEQLDGAALIDECRLRVLEHGQAGRLLAGFFVERGHAWAADAAAKHARLFDQVTGEGEKGVLHAHIRGLVAGFFGRGASSPATGPSSSTSPTASADVAPDSGTAAP